MMPDKQRAVFLDRDGTVIHDTGYLRQPQEVLLLPGAGEALGRLRKQGFLLIVVSNQSGIGRGLMTAAEAAAVHDRVVAELARYDVCLDAAYYCPHTPDDGCPCRKPSPEMLLRAAAEFNLDLAGSYLVGDKTSDIEAGQRAGCRTILMSTNPPADCFFSDHETHASDWPAVVEHILGDRK
jgi:histidinol-phosphate phosphatase family protein